MGEVKSALDVHLSSTDRGALSFTSATRSINCGPLAEGSNSADGFGLTRNITMIQSVSRAATTELGDHSCTDSRHRFLSDMKRLDKSRIRY